MIPYYGAKLFLARYYPPPKCKRIIEPFAGSAQYSLLHWRHEVLLVDSYSIIIDIWKWLQQCDKNDILSLPHLQHGQTVDEFTWPCQEAKHLMGFIFGAGVSSPRKTPSGLKTHWRPNTQNYRLNLIANNLHKIKHWEIRLGDYREIDNQRATWFIDPPYSGRGGNHYVKNNKHLDFHELGQWCQTRKGQVIVCENQEHTGWLPFQPLKGLRGVRKHTQEMIWTNDGSHLKPEQRNLLDYTCL